jgi:6-phosphogluconolactonase (cycloisomerase 2 family)
MQTNETENRIMHFGRNADGQLELLESIPTGGAGSGVFKPISGQDSAPNAFEGAGSVILAESKTLLFTTNGGNNSVTSFRVSPDGKLTVIDRQPTGEPVTGRSGTAKSLAYRPQSRTLYVLHAFGPNHLRSYTVTEDGKLKEASFVDAGGAGPFYIAFLNRGRDTFLSGVAVGDGVLVSRIDGEGRVSRGPLVAIDTAQGKPSELCWLQVTSDDSLVLATNFGYGTVSTYRLAEGRLSLLQDPANNAIPGDGTFRAVNGLVSSGPSDSWLTPDDQYFHQIFGNASVLVSYRLDKTSGRLTEIGRNPIPYNSPQGLAGF